MEAARTRVLIVEDEQELLEILATHLGHCGFAVLTALDGITAIRLFDQEAPDLVVLDLNVPEISGFRLLQLFRDSRPDVPVVITTALTFEEAEEVAKLHPDGFLTKPFDLEELAAKLRLLAARETKSA